MNWEAVLYVMAGGVAALAISFALFAVQEFLKRHMGANAAGFTVLLIFFACLGLFVGAVTA